jgi:translation initiation factor 2 beta subunit (eIF-2beta)/eIF-5
MKATRINGSVPIVIIRMMSCLIVYLKLFSRRTPTWQQDESRSLSWDLHKSFVSAPRKLRLQTLQKFVKLFTGKTLNNFTFKFYLTIWFLFRQPKHLLDFLLAELGTSGSVDGNSQLIIKGRFQSKQIENVLRR